MTCLSAVALLGFELEDYYLLAALLALDGGNHLSAFYEGSAYLQAAVAADEQDFGKLYSRAPLGVYLLYVYEIAGELPYIGGLRSL